MKRNLIKTLLFVILLVLAVVLGKAIGTAVAGVPYFFWLAISANFGVSTVTIDLSILAVTFGLTIDINVAQAILLLAAIFAYIRIQGKG